MRYSTSGMILAAMTIGEAMAGPTHAHLHRRAHEKKDVNYNTMDWDNMGVDWKSAYAAGQAEKTAAASPAVATPAVVAAVKASTTAVAAPSAPTAKSSSAAASSSSGSGSSTTNTGLGSLFGGVVGAANKLKSFGTAVAPSGDVGDHYRGNYGNPYGSNVIMVDSVGDHAYTNTFKNTQSKTITVNIWNKVGSDGQDLSGSALAPKDTTLTFTLAPGASQVVAFQENSQVAWAEAVSAHTPSGAFATTWGEANFNHLSGSAYDVSAIADPNKNYNMKITSNERKDCASSPTENSWKTDDVNNGFSGTQYGNCFIPMAFSTATLQTIMGGSSS